MIVADISLKGFMVILVDLIKCILGSEEGSVNLVAALFVDAVIIDTLYLKDLNLEFSFLIIPIVLF